MSEKIFLASPHMSKEGYEKEVKRLRKNMAVKGSSYEFISRICNLSVDEVKRILNN